LKKCFEEHKPQVFFDPVTGEVGTKVFKAMPNKTTTWTYGFLDKTNYGLQAVDLVFTGKIIRGFWLSHFIELNPMCLQSFTLRTLTGLTTDGNCSEIIINQRFGLKDWEKACEAQKANGTAGKCIFKCQEILND